MTMSRVLSKGILRILALLMLTGVGIGSCKLRRNSLRNAMGERDGLESLVPGSLSFRRSPTDNNIGELRFETKFDALYEVQYWIQNSNENNPKTFPCVAGQDPVPCDKVKAGRLFAANIPLDDNKYSLRLLIWPSTLTKSAAKSIRIDEDGAIGGDISDVIVSEMMVARTNLPLQTSEVYRHRLDQPMKVADIRAKLDQNIGCAQKETTFSNPFEDAESDLLISNLASGGFAAGSGKLHDKFPNRIREVYSAIDRQKIWEWSFDWQGNHQEFTTQPAAYLNRIFLSSGQEERLSNKELLSTVPKHKLLKPDSIQFRWEPFNLTKGIAEHSFLTVRMRGLTSNHTVTCVFEADGEQGQLGQGELPLGTVDPAIVKAMPADEYELLVVLESSQVQVRNQASFPAWLITSQDWRYEKLIKP